MFGVVDPIQVQVKLTVSPSSNSPKSLMVTMNDAPTIVKKKKMQNVERITCKGYILSQNDMSWQLSKQCFWHLGNMHLILLYQMNFKICLLSDKFIKITKRRLIQTTNIDSNSSQKFLKRTGDLKPASSL